MDSSRVYRYWDSARSHSPLPSLGQDACSHYGTVCHLLRDLLPTLPQPKRCHWRSPSPLPEELEAVRSDAMAALAEDPLSATSLLNDYRDAVAHFYTSTQRTTTDALTFACHRSSSWTRDLWSSYKLSRDHTEPTLMRAGRPLSPREHAGAFLHLFAGKHALRSHPTSVAFLASVAAALPPFTPLQWDGKWSVLPSELRMALRRINHSQSPDLWGIHPLLLDHLNESVLSVVATSFTTVLPHSVVLTRGSRHRRASLVLGGYVCGLQQASVPPSCFLIWCILRKATPADHGLPTTPGLARVRLGLALAGW